MREAEAWIRSLGLERHPEGGWFREIYRASGSIPREALPEGFSGARALSTAIYFLLSGDEFSALHRLRQDEIWHHYAGSSLTLHLLNDAGEYSTRRVGKGASANEAPLVVVEAGTLFGATVSEPNAFALVGCTVAPGFDFEDFEMPAREELLRRYPRHEAIVRRLTR